MPFDAPATQPACLLRPDQVSVYFDGTMTTPQLDHAEGLAFDAQGNLYCGGERGQIYRLERGSKKFEQVASTDGFCLGMAFDRHGDLYVCDSKHAAVFKFSPATGRLEKFADGAPGHKMRIPNYPAFDRQGYLYVSDSYDFKVPGPGIFRFTPEGEGELWCAQDFDFCNGLAFTPDGRYLYVAESYPSHISRIPIQPDGSAGRKEEVGVIGTVPDGLAFDAQGRLYIACYEPSVIYRHDPASGQTETVYHDIEAVVMCHPTNCAFWEDSLYAVNLGKCHITELEVGVRGVALPPQP